jgi:hypothetical protein
MSIVSGSESCRYVSGVPQRPQNVRTTGREDRKEAGGAALNEKSLDRNVTHATDGAPLARRHVRQ